MKNTRQWTALAAAWAVLILSGSMAALAAGPEKRIEPVLSGDGLYIQPWFQETFLDLKQDLADAQKAKKRLMVIWEQRGCPYCKKMHTENLAIPAVNHYVRDNFMVLQLNLWGDKEVTDFDGEKLPEKDLARKWGILFTPTLVFFKEAAEMGKGGKDSEAARMPGLFNPQYFLAMFRYVKEKRYPTTHFQKYLLETDAELKKLLGSH